LENQLPLLISLYEEEKVRLVTLIKEYLEGFDGPDYLLAHYHQQSLYQVQHTLQILNNFEDPLFDEKEHALRNIYWLEKQSENTTSEYLEEHLQKAKAKLAGLNFTPKVTSAHQEENILEKALSDLVYKKIKKFKLVLNNPQNFFLQFLSSGNTVKIVLPDVRSHIKKNTFYESHLTMFQKNGFEMTNGNKLVKLFNNKGEETIHQMRFLLVKVVFKIFHYKEFEKECFIVFQN
jgi:hypothetical protein